MPDAQSITLIATEVASAALCVLTGRTAYRAFRVTRAPALQKFAVGFLLLAVAQVLAASLEGLTDLDPENIGTSFDHFDALFWAYYAATAWAIGSIFFSFGRHPFKWSPVVQPVLLWAAPILQFLLAILWFFVVLHSGLNHIARARPGSLQTAAGFFLLLLGQFLVMIDLSAVASPVLEFLFPSVGLLNPKNPAGALTSLIGFLLLYLAAARPRGST